MSILAVRNNRGFSLVELMVSMAILSTTLLMIMGVFMTVIKSSQKAVDLTAGTIYAESLMNTVLRSIMTDPSERNKFFSIDSSNYPIVEGVDLLNNKRFTYKMYATDIAMPKSWRSDNKMKRVDVIVWWWAASSDKDYNVGGARESRDGYGVLRTEVTRIVNQQAVY